MQGKVISVSRGATHSFSKGCVDEIVVLKGLGVEGDAHAGEKVRHRYLVKKNPYAPNLAQVHLIAAELFDELRLMGLEIGPGEMGENVTTSGIDLIHLPLGTRLHLGATAVVEATGLRTPCSQMDGFRRGLKKACVGRDQSDAKELRAGVMGIALAGGTVRPGDVIEVGLPQKPWSKLQPV